MWLLAGAVVLCLLCAAGFVWFRGKNTDVLRQVVILTAAVALGMAAYDIRNPQRKESHYLHHVKEGERYRIVAEITSEPKRTAKRLKATAEVKAVETSDSLRQMTGKTVVYFDTTERRIEAGDVVVASGCFEEPIETVGDGFKYRKYMQRQGIVRVCFADAIEPLGSGDKARRRISELRRRLSETVNSTTLSQERQGIAKALVLGDRAAPLDITKEEFRAAGVSHLLCVSGLHVGIVALLAGGVVRLFGNGRRARWARRGVELAAVWLFVTMTGAAPSTLRAGVMFTFIIAGSVFYERGLSLNALGLSVLALLTWRPTLIADVGFELSYCAVWGIMTFERPISAVVPRREEEWWEARRKWVWVLRGVGEMVWRYVAVCVAAQVSILPLVLYYFHTLAPWFLIANVVIVPFAGLLLGSIMVMMAVSGWEWAWELMQRVVDWELGVICGVTHWVAGLPGALVEDVQFTLPMLAVAMATLVAVALWLERRKIG